jgi:hypothetical protein
MLNNIDAFSNAIVFWHDGSPECTKIMKLKSKKKNCLVILLYAMALTGDGIKPLEIQSNVAIDGKESSFGVIEKIVVFA